MEFGFSVAVVDYINNEIITLPILAIGDMATQIYAKICDNCYVEIVGYLSKTKQNKMYVLVKDIVVKEPKSKTQYFYSSKEFMEIFKPSSVIKNLVKQDKKEKKNEEN